MTPCISSLKAQLVVLAAQISWSENVEQMLQTTSSAGGDGSQLSAVLKAIESTLNVLADSVLYEQPPVRRKKLESLVCYFFLFYC